MRSLCARLGVEPDNVLNGCLPVVIKSSIPLENVSVCASNFPVIPRVVPLSLSEISLVVVRVAVGVCVSGRRIRVILVLVILIRHGCPTLIDINEVFEVLVLKNVELVFPLPELSFDISLVVNIEL